ncbi:MAG: gamma-glutamyltransferase family protein [Lautropia sp.]
MIATSCVPATQAGHDILRRGGSAVDAAIAADAVLGVVEPQQTGIGGDLFAIVCDDDRGIRVYNGSGRAPMAIDVAAVASACGGLAPESIHAVTIPGTVDAWCRLHAEHGRLPLDALLESAISLAEDGYPVSPRVAFDWQAQAGRLRNDPDASRCFLPGGTAPRAGDRIRNPALAETLRAVARNGRAGFYDGAVASALVADLRHRGGSHTLADFAAAACQTTSTISTRYQGFEIHGCPPNGQGVVALLALDVLAGLGLDRLDPASGERMHLHLEAVRAAQRLRNDLCGEEQPASTAIDQRASAAGSARRRDKIARTLRAAISPRHSVAHAAHGGAGGPGPANTVYLCAVDADGKSVSLMSSLYHYFGSGLCSGTTGVLFHSRGAGFALDEGAPNRLRGGARPPHTLMPALMTEGVHAAMPFGVMGGDYQPFGQAFVLSNMLDYGMDPQEALDAPRALLDDAGTWLERGIAPAVCDELARRGHRVATSPLPLGGGQAIRIDRRRGVLIAASDGRKDGCALGC